MQERHHVKTTPGEMKAPEIVPHPVRKEDGHDVQTDDINIPMVGIFVVFFAVLLSVVIISLQAWFYGYQDSERTRKLASQESTSTDLGKMLEQQRGELQHGPSKLRLAAAGATTAAASAPQGHPVPLERAMILVADQYRAGGNQNTR
jgi:hypothetical protein